MKIFVSNDIGKNPAMKTLFVFFLALELLFVAGAALMRYSEGGFSPASVRAYYLGDENAFTEPKSLTLILEEVHTRSFFAAVLLLTTCSILAVASAAERLKLILVYSTSAGALAYILSGPAIRYVSPVFSHALPASFALFHAGLCAMAVLSLAGLARK